MSEAAASAPKLSAATKVAYGTGAMANGVKSAAFSSYLMLYFNQVIGVPAGIVGTALACTLLVDAIVDPFLGRWADTTSTRWGRRHPFMYAAAIPTTLLFYCAWFPPDGLSHVQLGLWIFAFAAGTRAAISAFEINSAAMAPELTTVYAERTKLFSLRYWFCYSGAYGFTAFSLAFIFVESDAFPRGQPPGPFHAVRPGHRDQVVMGARVQRLLQHLRDEIRRPALDRMRVEGRVAPGRPAVLGPRLPLARRQQRRVGGLAQHDPRVRPLAAQHAANAGETIGATLSVNR